MAHTMHRLSYNTFRRFSLVSAAGSGDGRATARGSTARGRLLRSKVAGRGERSHSGPLCCSAASPSKKSCAGINQGMLNLSVTVCRDIGPRYVHTDHSGGPRLWWSPVSLPSLECSFLACARRRQVGELRAERGLAAAHSHHCTGL
jgi:hypothetical protein